MAICVGKKALKWHFTLKNLLELVIGELACLIKGGDYVIVHQCVPIT